MPESIIMCNYPTRIRINGAYITRIVSAQDVVVVENPFTLQYISSTDKTKTGFAVFRIPRIALSDGTGSVTAPTVTGVVQERAVTRAKV